MFLSELRIENFRIFGDGDQGLALSLRPGLTALVGQNDTGKTAVIDALRHALGTRDQEFFRVEESDFHQPPGATEHRKEIEIQCKFEGLTLSDKGAFAEYVTYEDGTDGKVPVVYLNWKAVAAQQEANKRPFTYIETRSGKDADGPSFDPAVKALLCATYLRPMRDAERAMSAGRASRLSQILQHTKEIAYGQEFDPNQVPPPDPKTLNIRGIGELADALLQEHQGVQSAREYLNVKYLKPLSFAGDAVEGRISVSGPKGDPNTRLRLLLEKLDLELRDSGDPEGPPNRGLGSNNLLFMACELLLLGAEVEGFPILLIEEPEAHLHPQRQLRLIQFLQDRARELREDDQGIQIILTTHSPNLASAIELDNLVLFHARKAFPLAFGLTGLDKSDYGFLARFLDVTKANLFFARGLLIVEGDAENLLVPALARLLGRDLTANGVAIVNVGGIGLSRFARIYLRKDPGKDGIIEIPVACVADLDIMPDCAPEIIGKIEPNATWPDKSDRGWQAKKDFTAEQLEKQREKIRARASGQRVKTFVADEWTFEYDLALSGLAAELWIAAHLARADERIKAETVSVEGVVNDAAKSYAKLSEQGLSKEEFAAHVYALLKAGAGVSKAITAQYLACLLEFRGNRGLLPADTLLAMLPKYIVEALEYVTQKTESTGSSEDGTVPGEWD